MTALQTDLDKLYQTLLQQMDYILETHGKIDRLWLACCDRLLKIVAILERKDKENQADLFND